MFEGRGEWIPSRLVPHHGGPIVARGHHPRPSRGKLGGPDLVPMFEFACKPFSGMGIPDQGGVIFARRDYLAAVGNEYIVTTSRRPGAADRIRLRQRKGIR